MDRSYRYLRFQHHNGNDNGDNAVAEGFQSVFVHIPVTR
jgi:hypothetical protein